MSSSIEQIKTRLSIVDVVGGYVKLEKAGANYRARCPFHNEKTPSFYVSPSRETYHCFGCGKGGDIISFVQEVEGLDFVGALELLAARAGVELKAPADGKARSEADRLYRLLDEATAFYESALRQTPGAGEYLASRGLSKETIASFRIGYAPAGWRNLFDHLKGKGYVEAEMEKAGLVIASNSTGSKGAGYYDRFRGRITFPLANAAGKVVGFSGRIWGAAGTPADAAKYINSPQTVLYDKSQVLYGYDKAKMAIKKEDCCVLVEGQMDLVMSHQAGAANTVAASGTALTDKHLGLVKRLSNNLVMAFDGDLAGISASRRGVEIALALGMEVKIAELPQGADPADVIAKDQAAWYTSVREAKHVVDFYLSVLAKRGLDARAFKLAVSRDVLPYVARLGNAIEQAHFVTKIAELLNVPQEPVWTEVRKLSGQAPAAAPQAPKEERPQAGSSRRDRIESRLYGLLFWQEAIGEKASADPPDIRRRLSGLLGPEADEREKLYASGRDRLILEAEIAYEGVEKISPELEELLLNLEEEILKERLGRVMGEMKQAEQSGDYERLQTHLHTFQEITNAINAIKSKRLSHE